MFIQLATYSMYSFFLQKMLKINYLWYASGFPWWCFMYFFLIILSFETFLQWVYRSFICRKKNFLIGVAYSYINLEEICCFNNWSPLPSPLSCIVELLVNRFLLLPYVGPPERTDLWAWNAVGTFMGWLKHLALKCPDYFGPPVLIKSIGPHCSQPWGPWTI